MEEREGEKPRTVGRRRARETHFMICLVAAFVWKEKRSIIQIRNECERGIGGREILGEGAGVV